MLARWYWNKQISFKWQKQKIRKRNQRCKVNIELTNLAEKWLVVSTRSTNANKWIRKIVHLKIIQWFQKD